MAGITLNDNATQSLLTALDGLSVRQRVIANNLANINTPGFKASDVDFASQLEKAMQPDTGMQMVSTQVGHLSAAARSEPTQAQIITRNDTSQRFDGNNVDLEKEMTCLTETLLHYQTATKMVSSRLALLRTVINEGRR